MTRARDLADFNLDGKAVTINESSADLDFRVESNGNANMLVVDAGNDRVGVGTASPSHLIHAVGADSTNMIVAENATGVKTAISHGTNDGRIGNVTNHGLIFTVNDAEKARITTGGQFRLQSAGITFNNDTAAANELDDYEEGVHTTSVTCGTSGTISLTALGDDLSYTKIGNVVNVRGMLQVDTVSSPVGNIKINLPFTIGSGDGFSARTPCTAFLLNSSSNVSEFVAILFEGDTNIVIYLGDGLGAQSDSAQSVDGNEEIYVNATYKVA